MWKFVGSRSTHTWCQPFKTFKQKRAKCLTKCVWSVMTGSWFCQHLLPNFWSVKIWKMMPSLWLNSTMRTTTPMVIGWQNLSQPGPLDRLCSACSYPIWKRHVFSWASHTSPMSPCCPASLKDSDGWWNRASSQADQAGAIRAGHSRWCGQLEQTASWHNSRFWLGTLTQIFSWGWNKEASNWERLAKQNIYTVDVWIIFYIHTCKLNRITLNAGTWYI